MTKFSTRRVFLISATSLVLTGCAVPRGAPSKNEVLSGANRDDADFALELVTRDRLPDYARWYTGESYLTASWPSRAGAPTDQRLAPGDRLALRIWDAGDSSLIAAAGAPFADVENVVVSGSGHIDLPYIDSVHVGGLTLAGARARLQERLTEIIPSAQVQAEVTQGRRNSVDIVAGVASSGSYPMSERNLALTSLLASAGGVKDSLNNPVVQITRGGRVYRQTLEKILSDPTHDPGLQGGDRIAVIPDPRKFTVLGATGSEQVMDFDAHEISALRAVSMTGGMSDARADPKGILVLRRYPAAKVGHAGGPEKDRVVFSFDLTRADGLFSADEFKLQDGDILLATQAPATTVQRVLGLFGALLGTSTAVQAL